MANEKNNCDEYQQDESAATGTHADYHLLKVVRIVKPREFVSQIADRNNLVAKSQLQMRTKARQNYYFAAAHAYSIDAKMLPIYTHVARLIVDSSIRVSNFAITSIILQCLWFMRICDHAI